MALCKETLLVCKGYNPRFIDRKTNISLHTILRPEHRKNLDRVEGDRKRVLHYTDFSVMYHHKRKIPYFVAYNLDGKAEKIKTKRANEFTKDPRISSEAQLDQDFYDLVTSFTEFEIGHMASHAEMSWGNDAQLRAYQTFHFPNSVPQVERLNAGLWRSLETYLIQEISSLEDEQKVNVFTGPFILANDPLYKMDPSFQIPLHFYKIVVFKWNKKLYSTCFIMSQEKRLRELDLVIDQPEILETTPILKPAYFNDFKYKDVFQVNIQTVEEMTGLKFKWKKVEPISIEGDYHAIERIKNISGADDIPKNAERFQAQNVGRIPRLNFILPK